MDPTTSVALVLNELNALAGGLFLLTAFGLIATRQVLGSLKVFVAQSALLAASAFLLGWYNGSIHLLLVAAITLATKVMLIPWLLRRMLSKELYARREVSQVFNIPTSLLIALALAIFGFFIARPLSGLEPGPSRLNLPIGLAGLLIGAYAISVRREAIPQVIGILAMENGAFFAAVSIAAGLPMMAELAAAFDVVIVAVVMGLLAQRIHERIGFTAVGDMASLKER